MKHNTKHAAGTSAASKKRQIGLRPEADEMLVIEELAKREMRSVAQMALICLRHGLRDIQARTARAER